MHTHDHPTVGIAQEAALAGARQMERVELSELDVAYLVGKGGATRIRLENFSGARLNIDKDVAEVELHISWRAFACVAPPVH